MRAPFLLVATLVLTASSPAAAQDPRPLYRVFLADGTTLVSFGEWMRVEDRVVFSMPTTPGAGPADLHLVSIPVSSVDLSRSERYADAVRAANYAATRGEADFAKVSAEVAQALNQVALIADPKERLKAAERARRSLSEWPGAHYGYRAAEVREIVGVLDGVISGLRASTGQGQSQGQGRFDLALSATTEQVFEPLQAEPDHTEVVQHLMKASTLASSPAEKVSLLQSVIALVDRAVDLLPTSLATTIRETALATISEEHQTDQHYARLRTVTLSEAERYAARGDLRTIDRLKERLLAEDRKLGGRRAEDVAAIVATLDAHLDAALRLRLAMDQWTLRVGVLRGYHRASSVSIRTLEGARPNLDDIRGLTGPAPHTLRPLAQRLSRAARQLALIEVPPELAAIHAVFRSAYELAENAVQLRLDAITAADVALARQASAAASGALMLLGRGRADLEAALRPPSPVPLVSQ